MKTMFIIEVIQVIARHGLHLIVFFNKLIDLGQKKREYYFFASDMHVEHVHVCLGQISHSSEYLQTEAEYE